MKEINRKPRISEEGSRQEDAGILPFPARGQALKMRSRDSEKRWVISGRERLIRST
jgi:hypothetical protein